MKKSQNIHHVLARILLPFALTICLAFQHCTFSVLTEFQSAKPVGKGKAEIAASTSLIGLTVRSIPVQTSVMGAYGLNSKIDFTLRHDAIFRNSNFYLNHSIHVLQAGIKFGIVTNRVALHIPVRTSITPYDNLNFAILPAVIFTFPVNPNRLELSIVTKLLIKYIPNPLSSKVRTSTSDLILVKT